MLVTEPPPPTIGPTHKVLSGLPPVVNMKMALQIPATIELGKMKSAKSSVWRSDAMNAQVSQVENGYHVEP